MLARWGAVYAPDPRYRYALWRHFVDAPENVCVWVMLNPSTATELIDDPTVYRCQQFAKAWGYDAAVVVNIFAWRSTDPRGLRTVDDPVGPENDAHILARARAASRIIVAWGVHGAYRGRAAAVRQLLAGFDLWCLGTTKSGEPRHPLYLAYGTQLTRWP